MISKPEPITVSQVNEYIKEKIDTDEFLNNVYIKGEISNYKQHYTGHLYFTLKDGESLIKCIMFKTYTSHLNFIPKDGMSVLILGTVSVFKRDGVYQIYCKVMQEAGIGDLYEKFEQLKARLEEEGLFEQQYKQKIPLFPQTIGVLTSQTGSVIRDIINVGTRRNPNVHIRLLPIPVQGEGASYKIAEAIQYMNEQCLADVIILARGGGSLEDLWPFNEERVARAIFASKLPIISAIGHETDFTIADFVADLRAPTPSAAAELAVPNIIDLQSNLKKLQQRMQIGLQKKLEYSKLQYEKVMVLKALREPFGWLEEEYNRLENTIKQMVDSVKEKQKNAQFLLANSLTRLDSLSPLKTLSRGYGIIQKEDKVIQSCADVTKGDRITIRLYNGTIKAKVEEKTESLKNRRGT